LTGGAVGTGILPPAEQARAEALSLPAPVQSGPSFADVIERVKPAVVSVRVKARNVSDDGEAQFGGPGMNDEGMREFFRRFGGERFGQRNERFGDRDQQRPTRAASASRRAPASSSPPTATS
jgi:serine protease Do